MTGLFGNQNCRKLEVYPMEKILWGRLFTCCKHCRYSQMELVCIWPISCQSSSLKTISQNVKVVNDREGWAIRNVFSIYFSLSWFYLLLFNINFFLLSISPFKVFLLFWLDFFPLSVELWFDIPEFLKNWKRTNIYWALVMCQLLD